MAKINGNNGDNTLKGTKFKDLILGKDGDDTIKGKDGNDDLRGGADNDRIYGSKGNDKLSGDGGDDLLDGGAGKDTFDGASGIDAIYGGKGDDEIKSGSGNDPLYFKFTKASGRDVITDFHHGEDKLYISKGFGFDTAQDVVDATHLSNGSLAIDLSGTGDPDLQIILLGINTDPSHILGDIILIA